MARFKKGQTVYDGRGDKIREMVVARVVKNPLIQFGGKKLSMEQIRFAGSCRNEVGWTKDDRLVCYDLDEYKKY